MSCDPTIDPMIKEKFENVIKLIVDMTYPMPNRRPDCLTILSKTSDWCLQSKQMIENTEMELWKFRNLYKFYNGKWHMSINNMFD